MYQELQLTSFPPENKPVMVWDGNCGFCHYWIIKWEKMSGEIINYQPYSDVEADFPDIDTKHFKEAVRLIDTDGTIYSGAEAAFKSFQYSGHYSWLFPWYKKNKWVKKLFDQCYQWIADHRPLAYQISVLLFGENPARPKPYWMLYLLLLIFIVVFFTVT